MIDLTQTPSEDGAGVLCWTYPIAQDRILKVFKRPPEYARTPYLLRVDHISGAHIESRFATSRDGAIAIARRIEQLTSAA